MANVIEFVSFKLKDGVSEQQFIAASDELNQGFLALQKGYINRKLIKEKDTWADLVIWETMEDAMNAIKAIEQNSAAELYCSYVEDSSCIMQHLDVIKSY